MSIKNVKNKINSISTENVSDFVNKYLAQIIYFLCFLLIVIFISIFVLNRKSSEKEQLMVKYYRSNNMIKENDYSSAIKTLDEIYNSKSSDENIKAISGIRLADLSMERGEEEKALKIYKEIYSLTKIDNFLKNLSGLTALNILINQNNSENYSEIEQLIGKLNNPNNPVLNIVLEKQGIFEIQRGNIEKGVSILKNLLKSNIDEESEKRISQIIKSYESL